MAKIVHEEVKRSSRKKLLRIKYYDDDGKIRIVTKEAPDDFDLSVGSSGLVKNLFLWLALSASLIILYQNIGTSKQYVSADKLKTSISTAVKNGAGLEVVKNIFQNREAIKKGILSIFSEKVSEYSYDVPLSSVLSDIKSELYLKESRPASDIVGSIDSLLKQQKQKNPFDKLPKQQKDYFENIRIKSGHSYELIQNDINNLSDELFLQNILVDTYLSDSRTSLYVSICSLLFALIISSYQIYQGRPRKLAENLKVLIEGIFSEKSIKESEGGNNDKAPSEGS